MIFALLPVKALDNAKQRLNGLLTPEQRGALARVMYEEVLEKLLAARGLDRIVVVSSDEGVLQHARRRSALAWEESEQRGHSQSADAASRRAAEMGAETVLLAPIDVPLVTTKEIETLAAAAHPGIVIVPSTDGTGTNALVRTPPQAIASRFGKDSFRLHVEEARARGFSVEVMRLPGFMFDLDTPEDAAELVARAPQCRTAELLRSIWALTS